MKVQVKTAQFNVAPEVVYDFISKIENLPKWATNYAKSVRKVENDYIVDTPMGELIQKFECNEKSGVIDMHAGPSKDQLWTWYLRIFSNNFGASILNFTSIQMPGQPEADFNGQCDSLEEEFENIRKAVEG